MKIVLLTILLFNISNYARGKELVIYSSRKEKFIRPLLDQFQQDSKIKVRLLSAVPVMRVLAEQKRPLGNIYISNDVSQLEFLRIKGALESAQVDPHIGIPLKYRAKDNSWVGLSARSRILIYNTSLISKEEMPKTLWELGDPRFKKAFAITRGSNGSMITHIAALSNVWGERKTTEWLRKLTKNAGAITKGHTEIRQAVGRGEFKFGLINNYYYHLQKKEKKHNQVAPLYPDQANGMGVFVNSAGVALLKNPQNLSEARTFIKWVTKPQNQTLFTKATYEVPLNPNIKSPVPEENIKQYKTMNISLDSLGHQWLKSRKIIERAGLDLTVR